MLVDINNLQSGNILNYDNDENITLELVYFCVHPFRKGFDIYFDIFKEPISLEREKLKELKNLKITNL